MHEDLISLERVSDLGRMELLMIRLPAFVGYHFDWTLVPEDPHRFENLVASHRLEWVHFQEDASGRDVELRYFRLAKGTVLLDATAPPRTGSLPDAWRDGPGHGSRVKITLSSFYRTEWAW